MGWAALITAFFNSLTAYFQLKYKSSYQDILYKSYDRQDDIVKEMDKLGKDRTPDNQSRIVILQERLLQEHDRLKHLSAEYTASISGTGNKNS